jgi:hypothetical protein
MGYAFNLAGKRIFSSLLSLRCPLCKEDRGHEVKEEKGASLEE